MVQMGYNFVSQKKVLHGARTLSISCSHSGPRLMQRMQGLPSSTWCPKSFLLLLFHFTGEGEENGGAMWEPLGSGGECHTQSPTSFSAVKLQLHSYTNCEEGGEMWFTSMHRKKERINFNDLIEDSAKYSKDLF